MVGSSWVMVVAEIFALLCDCSRVGPGRLNVELRQANRARSHPETQLENPGSDLKGDQLTRSAAAISAAAPANCRIRPGHR